MTTTSGYFPFDFAEDGDLRINGDCPGRIHQVLERLIGRTILINLSVVYSTHFDAPLFVLICLACLRGGGPKVTPFFASKKRPALRHFCFRM